MLKAIYILESDYQNDKFRQNLLKELSEISNKNTIFFPISDINEKNCNTFLTKSEAKEILKNGKKNQLIKSIISKFDSIDANFIVIVGSSIESLDADIAKNLNAPFYLSPESEFKKDILGFTYINNINEIKTANSSCITPLKFEKMLFDRAKSNLKTVVLPESNDDRVLKAAQILLENEAVNIILLGEKINIEERAKFLNLNLEKAVIINTKDNAYKDDFTNTLYELRKSKGMELEKAKSLMEDRTYFGTMLVYKGVADAMVSGASTTTAQTIRPALQFIKMKPGISNVSGSFIVCLDTKTQIYADCAITPNPTTDQLANIAISTAKTAKNFGLDPKVAMLSYSTGDSGCGEDVDFIIEATKKAKELDPNLKIEGPIQFDAAVDKAVAAKKLPNSAVAGNANTFIFPNLNCGNICYKAVQRTANAIAIGPILQGLNKPVNDLSRGCLVEDIVNTVLISAIQSQGE
ncbi:phosphate acetyltransferase [Campylobacter fetus]|uniref:phosphate acetyltransferase n=1 Tax=Campylobacter fetus TaxID=196 RepID=UPI002890E252|nr:phosphate acetyltransferase [Campylobacter fetus subsp. venerealis]